VISRAAVVARAEVLEMQRTPQAPFRYWGRVKMMSPDRYKGKEVNCFLLSHKRDLSDLVDQMIEVATDEITLERELNPMDAFSVGNIPILAAEESEGRFQKFDQTRYDKPLTVTAHVVTLEPATAEGEFHFMFDMMFSGEMVTLVVDTPELYRGTEMHVLVERELSPTPRWKEIGETVEFSTPESPLAWEPWGFTRAADLQQLQFRGKSQP
jgi:hypothetical protein